MDKPKIKIDIVSDVICPWCYIGKRRLEKALNQVSDKYKFELEYRPFELNPNTAQTGVNQKEHLIDKFGGEDRYIQITEHTASVAEAEGLHFNFDKQYVTPNTRSLHAVIEMAKSKGRQLETVEAFFKAYFIDGVDLSKAENIISIAQTAGLIKEDVEQYLSNDDHKLQIALAEKEIYALGITGVPFYIINNKYGISGAQHPDTFIKAIENIGAALVPSTGEVCDVDSKNC